MGHKTLAFAVALLAAGPAQAESHAFDGCDIAEDAYQDIVLPILDGTWQATNGGGLMVV